MTTMKQGYPIAALSPIASLLQTYYKPAISLAAARSSGRLPARGARAPAV